MTVAPRTAMDHITAQLAIASAPEIRRQGPDISIDHIVTVGYFDRLGYSRPEASDTGDRFVFPDGPSHPYETFRAAALYVNDALEQGDSVVVHCQAGVSRSAGICGAVLAEREGVCWDTAIEMVAEARPRINPQPSIVNSAQRYIQSDRHRA